MVLIYVVLIYVVSILRDANLRDADLRDADLHGADLHGADLRGATVPLMNFDKRGYTLHIRFNKKILFIAGCRKFTFEEAIEHWGSESYLDKKRGKLYIRQIKMLNDAYHAGELYVTPDNWK